MEHSFQNSFQVIGNILSTSLYWSHILSPPNNIAIVTPWTKNHLPALSVRLCQVSYIRNFDYLLGHFNTIRAGDSVTAKHHGCTPRSESWVKAVVCVIHHLIPYCLLHQDSSIAVTALNQSFSLPTVDSTFVDGLKPVLQKLSNSELFSTIIPGRIHATRTCHGKILELRVCALESVDSGSSVDRSLNGIRNPFVENSKMSVTEKYKKYLLDYRVSKSNKTERCSDSKSIHSDSNDSNRSSLSDRC